MAKASIQRQYSVNAHGILMATDDGLGIEVEDTGEVVMLTELLSDFTDKTVNLSVNYDEDYE